MSTHASSKRRREFWVDTSSSTRLMTKMRWTSPGRIPIFGVAVNLGAGVNTALHEFAPDASADGLTILFQRRNDAGGLGSDDLWMATRASTSESFGPAVNLAARILKLAPMNGVVVSAATAEALGDAAGFDIDPLGAIEMPGLLEPVELASLRRATA